MTIEMPSNYYYLFNNMLFLHFCHGTYNTMQEQFEGMKRVTYSSIWWEDRLDHDQRKYNKAMINKSLHKN